MKILALLLLSLPAFAQGGLSLSCPAPIKFNQPAVCTIAFTGTAAALQWTLTTSQPASLSVASLISSKSIGVGLNGLYTLSGMNATNVSGNVATVTIPPHSGTVTLNLSNAMGASSTAHIVVVTPSVTVTVQ